MMKSMVKAVVAAAALSGASAAAADDAYLWLEEIEGAKALDWARAENERSLAELKADPRFQPMLEEAKSILTSTDRIAAGAIHNGAVYNFWQDDTHVRGLWRRASVESYRAGAPDWETLIDVDALAQSEGENWVFEHVNCLSPEYRLCMVELSYGGKDAGILREFDTETKEFVDGGFYVPEAKTTLAWIDKDTILIGTDWGEGTLTESGYARSNRIWKRGEPLADAKPYYQGEKEDVAVFAHVEHDDDVAHVFSHRAYSFFETEYYYSRNGDAEPVKLPLPGNADLEGVLDGRAVFNLREPWSYQGGEFPVGAIVAYDLGQGGAELVFAAAGNQSIEDVDVGKTGLVLQYLEDVAGKAVRLSRNKKGKWTQKAIRLPENGVVKIISAGGGTDDAIFSFESLTSPNTLLYVSAKNKVESIAKAPAFYDAEDVVVEQRFATSRDGTRIPYFIMGRDSVLKKGNAPTVQYAYGGFLSAILPVYYEDPARPQHGALAGKMWIARGGVLVISNIRGGSEYGPAWHKAAMKEKHQNPIDDFIAISEDLIESGVTTPKKLGAIGRSNGGLLMGAILTQRPELYAAIDCGVPLFDMKRYTKLGAGASWVGEYGDPDIPEEWAYISKYSPYQNLKAGQSYPKILLYTSTQDDRVHPGHARKAGAKLKELGYDFFFYENMEGGHGGAANQDQLAFRTALEYVYFAKQLMPLAE